MMTSGFLKKSWLKVAHVLCIKHPLIKVTHQKCLLFSTQIENNGQPNEHEEKTVPETRTLSLFVSK